MARKVASRRVGVKAANGSGGWHTTGSLLTYSLLTARSSLLTCHVENTPPTRRPPDAEDRLQRLAPSANVGRTPRSTPARAGAGYDDGTHSREWSVPAAVGSLP